MNAFSTGQPSRIFGPSNLWRQLLGLLVAFGTCSMLSAQPIVINEVFPTGRVEENGSPGACLVDGGAISTEQSTDLCLNGEEGAGVVEFSVTDAVGDANAWVVTDDAGNILGLPESGTIDFSGAGPGICVVYFLSWAPGDLMGLEPGNNIADLSGCFDLSNGIEVDRYEVNGGTISTEDPTTVCLDDDQSNVVHFSVSGSAGEGRSWVVTDEAGNILALPESGTIDFSGAGPGVCPVYYIRWQPGKLQGLEAGRNIADLTGCFDLSNSIAVTRLTGEDCEAEQPLAITGFRLHDADANQVIGPLEDGDQIPQPGVSLNIDALSSQEEGTGSVLLVLVGPERKAMLENVAPYTLFGDNPNTGNLNGSELPPGEYSLTAIPFTGEGQSGLPGYPLTITFEILPADCPVDGGTIATEQSTDLCLNGEEGAGVVEFSVADVMGDANAWVVTDDAGNILGLPESGTIDFSGAGPGICVVYFLSWAPGELMGLEPGNNIADLRGCFDLSNGIEVDRYEVNGGVISTEDPTTVCLDDDQSNVVNFSVSGSAGEGRSWVVTDEAGNILALPESGTIDFSGAGPGVCPVYYIRWQPGKLQGLEAGRNIADLTGCFDLSNSIAVTRLTGEDCEAGLAPEISGFQLANAEENSIIGPLMDGDQIPYSDLDVSIIAEEKGPAMGSVVLELEGPVQVMRTENLTPYTVFGDNPETGDLRGRKLVPGTYTLTATPYSEAGAKGEAGTPLSITFEVVENISIAAPAAAIGQDGERVAAPLDLLVFPNPSDGSRLNLSFSKDMETPFRVLLHDQQGRLILNQEVGPLGREEVFSLPISRNGLTPGLYALQILVGDQVQSVEKVLINP